MTREKWWKIFRLPSPKELGWADSNALPMSIFQKVGDDTPTWEDWEEKVRKEYPIRYFMSETLPSWFRRNIQRHIRDSWYWLTCHILPSRKYHRLDLTQPNYKYGWIDSDTKMLYALFNILNEFVKQEMPHWYCPSEEEAQSDPHLVYQRNNWLEAKAIHYWWNVERPRQIQEHAEMLHRWSDAQKENLPEAQELWASLNKLEKFQEEKEDEMVARLLKIRRSLWT